MATQTSLLNVGDRLPSVVKTVTVEKMEQFEALGQMLLSEEGTGGAPNNIHTDRARAHEMGLDRPIASGQMTFAYLHELLARQFGPDFRQGGQLSVTFIKPVYGGDTVTAQGVVTSKEEVGRRTRLVLQVWVENQHGEKISLGEAQVVVPSPLT